MIEYIVTIIIGIIFIIVGVSNIKGNISMLHSYHIKRVKKKDVKILGKKVGIGLIIIACGFILSGIISIYYVYNGVEASELIEYVVLLPCLVIGCLITLVSIIKYNKGLF